MCVRSERGESARRNAKEKENANRRLTLRRFVSTMVKQYENAVMQKRLEELPASELEKMMDELDEK